MEDKTLRMAMLFDFFGDLLTAKQREYFDLYYNEDLSLSEIAERAHITRQGVYDIILRAQRSLETLEAKTGVVKRFDDMRIKLAAAAETAHELAALAEGEAALLAGKLLSEIEQLGL